jgi:hypothetical protein
VPFVVSGRLHRLIKKGDLMKVLMLLIVIASVSAGCAAHLRVFNDKGDELKGIPVRDAKAFRVTKKVTWEKENAPSSKCLPTRKQEILFLPAGREYLVTVEPAAFAKSEFSVALNDNGALKQVALNSTPQAVDTIKATAELVGKLAPAGLLAAQRAEECGRAMREDIENIEPIVLP